MNNQPKGSRTMRRTEHLGARTITSFGLISAAAYLAWRTVFTVPGTVLWLSVPVVAVELIAVLGAAVLAWALWPSPAADVVSPPPSAPAATDVVIRVQGQMEHEVRATTLAALGLGAARVHLLDLGHRPAIATLAEDLGVGCTATDDDDVSGLTAALAVVTAPRFLLLDAGDIPAPDLLSTLTAELADERVAVVQGLGLAATYDSPEYGPGGRHELLFERASLNPALGARGAAMWLGSGSLVRTEALRSVRIADGSGLVAAWLTGASLVAAGWRVRAPGDVPVFAHRTILSEQEVFDDRVERVRGARRLVFGRNGALFGRGLAWRQRLTMLAWSVRPLSGLRRVAFVALLEAALLSGHEPFRANAFVLIGAWLPSFLALSLGLALLSGWSLRPGDRARWSLHSIGPAWASIRGGRPRQQSRPARARHEPIVALPARQYGGGLVTVIVSLGIVLLLRGASDRLSHTLGELPRPVLMLLLIVTLWTLALSLDLLRVLGRHHQMRRTARVVSSLPATMGERSVSIIDLTSLGAGLISQTGAEVKERTVLETVITTTSGVTTVRQPCVVRNVHQLRSGDFRIGVEFGERDRATANALAEYCSIEPMWSLLGVLPGRLVTPQRRTVYLDTAGAKSSPGRALVRAVALVALFGATASAVPETAAATSTQAHLLSGQVVEVGGAVREGVLGAVVVGVCSYATGADDEWGTADDTYDEPQATVTDIDGNYELELFGIACWIEIQPPVAHEVTDDAAGREFAPAVIDVSGATTTRPLVEVRPIVLADPIAPGAAASPTVDGSDGARADAAILRWNASIQEIVDEWASTGSSGEVPRVLPEPSSSQLGELPQPRTSMSLFVIAFSVLLAGGLLVGLTRPRSRVVA